MSSLLHKLAGLSFMKVVFVSFCGRRVLKVVFIFLLFGISCEQNLKFLLN